MYEVVAEGDGYKVKRIEVNPGQRLSLQMHQSRSEHWVVVSREAVVTIEEREIRLRGNEDALIPPRTKHRVANPGTGPLVLSRFNEECTLARTRLRDSRMTMLGLLTPNNRRPASAYLLY